MNITSTTRLTSALVAAAAFGTLAIGMAGTAGADPATDPGSVILGDTTFTVVNSKGVHLCVPGIHHPGGR
jgi:hypothetical protein